MASKILTRSRSKSTHFDADDGDKSIYIIETKSSKIKGILKTPKNPKNVRFDANEKNETVITRSSTKKQQQLLQNEKKAAKKDEATTKKKSTKKSSKAVAKVDEAQVSGLVENVAESKENPKAKAKRGRKKKQEVANMDEVVTTTTTTPTRATENVVVNIVEDAVAPEQVEVEKKSSKKEKKIKSVKTSSKSSKDKKTKNKNVPIPEQPSTPERIHHVSPNDTNEPLNENFVEPIVAGLAQLDVIIDSTSPVVISDHHNENLDVQNTIEPVAERVNEVNQEPIAASLIQLNAMLETTLPAAVISENLETNHNSSEPSMAVDEIVQESTAELVQQNEQPVRAIVEQVVAGGSEAFQVTSSLVAATSENRSAVEMNPGEPQPKQQPRGGARIVKPKVQMSDVKLIVNKDNVVIEEQVVKKQVELVRREAGPRIVKPTIEIQDDDSNSKRKALDSNPVKPKKIKEKISCETKPTSETETNKRHHAPDFKSIHAKDANKQESIDDYQKRIQERHKAMSFRPSPTTSSNTVAFNTSGLITNEKSKLNRAMSLNRKDLPYEPTKKLKTIVSTVELAANVPVDNKRSKKIRETESQKDINGDVDENQENVATSPIGNRPSKLNVNQTPNRPHLVEKTNDLLASSSFFRRKSYDLINRSLTKQLPTYKPYISKIKPIDGIKSIATSLMNKLQS